MRFYKSSTLWQCTLSIGNITVTSHTYDSKANAVAQVVSWRRKLRALDFVKCYSEAPPYPETFAKSGHPLVLIYLVDIPNPNMHQIPLGEEDWSQYDV